MGTTGCLKLATPCLSRLTSCCSSSSSAVSTMYFYNDQYFRIDEVCFKHFLGLHRISLQEGFCAYMKFEKYFFHPTTPQFIHLNEGISLLTSWVKLIFLLNCSSFQHCLLTSCKSFKVWLKCHGLPVLYVLP